MKTGADVAEHIVEQSNHEFQPQYFHRAGLIRFRALVANGRTLDEAIAIIDADHAVDERFRTWLIKHAPCETLNA